MILYGLSENKTPWGRRILNNRNFRSVRIIGGNWRGRKIEFANDPVIRPTPSRIRETLFNWLQHSIRDARCLELYAGSGILSLEALSRGARHITVVDQSASAVWQINNNLTMLRAAESQFQCINSEANGWIGRQSPESWDIIFLDPPFDSQELKSVLPLITERQLLVPGGSVYIESRGLITPDDIPGTWQIHRNKKASRVHYCLCHQTGT